ncbi:MAG: site-specific integrase [Elusimicrobiaceae bacterium]|nr:site-specific integrase [Elusimicrobiaceae bacterium]
MPPINKISGFKRKGRNGQRYRKQINGRVYEKYFTGNKDQREQAYKKWVKQLQEKRASRAEDHSITYTEFKEKFLSYLRLAVDKGTGKPRFKDRTIEEYEYCLINFDKVMKPHYMGDMEYFTLAEYRRRIRAVADEEDANYYGVNKKMGCIIRAFKWGMTEGYVPVINTAPLEKKLDTGKIVVHTMTPREVSLLLKYSPLKWRVAIKIGYYTGVRPEEMINLLKSKINFQTGVTKIYEHDADPKRGITAWAPKRNKRRLVLLPPDVLEDIKKLQPETYIILRDNGIPYNDTNFSNSFKANLKHVNKEILRHEQDTAPVRCTYKTLRKSNITTLMDMGLDEKDASLGLGHADKKTSEKHYINALTLAKQKEREQLAQLKKVKGYILKLPQTLQK